MTLKEKLASIVQKVPSKADLSVILRYGGVEEIVERLETVRAELNSIVKELEGEK